VAAAVHRAKRKKRKKSAASKMLAATGRFAGRTMKRGWRSEAARKTRAAVLQGVRKSAAAVGRGIKKTPRAIFDAILAAGAGVLSGLWHVSASAALRRLRDVWNRRRARAAERRARAAERRAAKKTAQDGTAPVPAAPATFVRRPAHAGTGPSTLNGGTNMPGGGHHFVAPAMESLRIAGAYNPQGMAEVGADFAGLAEALELEAEAIRITVENANANWPLNQGIVDILAQVHNLKIKAAELAKELPVAFENLHDVDLARLRNPRKGAAEAMWDYSRNPGA
jgi:hypothetical protein